MFTAIGQFFEKHNEYIPKKHYDPSGNEIIPVDCVVVSWNKAEKQSKKNFRNEVDRIENMLKNKKENNKI